MPRRVKELSNIEIDEISLVDRPANQHARVAIAKRATEEEIVPELFDETGEAIELEDLVDGQIVFDAEGEAYVWNTDDEDETDELAYENELELVGKSFGDSVREELSKALTDIERDDVIAKAADEISKAEARAAAAEHIAKAERDLRLTREYVAKAAEYNVPIDPVELGPVLMRMANAMDYEDCAVIHKALSAAGEALFEELGYDGMASHNDVIAEVDAYASEFITKSDSKVSKFTAQADIFSSNPALYDQYLATRNSR
jgi:hypothetical protein